MTAVIKTIDSWLQTKFFSRLRLIQFTVAIVIFTSAALIPSNLVPTTVPDYNLHFIGNILLFLSASVAACGRMKLGLLILLLIPYSGAVELSQWLTPSRQVDPKDMLANMLGLFIGFVIVHMVEWAWSALKQSTHGSQSS